MKALVEEEVAMPIVEIAVWTSESERRPPCLQVSVASIFYDDEQPAVLKQIWVNLRVHHPSAVDCSTLMPPRTTGWR